MAAMSPRNHIRMPFTGEDDEYLMKYLARYCPSKKGRMGNVVFQTLVENAGNKWPWSKHHPWNSWRERYKKNTEYFDRRILKYQKKHGIRPDSEPQPRKPKVTKSNVDYSSMRSANDASDELEQRPTKRPRVDKNGSPKADATGKHPTASSSVAANPTPHKRESGSRYPTTKLQSPHSDEAFVAKAINDAESRPESSPTPVAITADGNGEPSRLPTTPEYRARLLSESETAPAQESGGVRDVDEISRDGSNMVRGELAPPTPELEVSVSSRSSPLKGYQTPQRPQRPLLKRRRSPSLFGSSPSPSTAVATGNLLSPLKHIASKATSLNGPRYAMKRPDLVGQTGRTPLLSGPLPGKSGEATDQGDEQAQSPAEVTERKGKERADANDQTPSQVEPSNTREIQKVNRPPSSDNGTIAGRLIDQTAAGISNQPAINGMSGKVDERSGHTSTESAHPDAATKTSFLGPRPSSRSPFRPPELPQERSRAKNGQHPALARVRRQTFGAPERSYVPSIDLATLSASTSRNSSESVINAPLARQSLPAHLTPPLLRSNFLSTSAGPSTRTVSPLFHPQLLYEHGQLPIQPIPTTVTTPRTFPTSAFTFVPPINPFATPGQVPLLVHTPSRQDSVSSTSTSLSPHPPDLHLVTAHGLTSLLSSMSVNHGLALDVVIAVYQRARSLRETDEVLRGMREAAEGYAADVLREGGDSDSTGRQSSDRSDESGLPQRARNLRNRRESSGAHSHRKQEATSAELEYNPAPSDTSEYSPPETTRAAEWKRRSMGRISTPPLRDADEIGDEHQVEPNEDDAEKECVEEVEVENALVEQIAMAMPNGDDDTQDRYNMHPLIPKVKNLEQELGKERYRRHIVSLFK